MEATLLHDISLHVVECEQIWLHQTNEIRATDDCLMKLLPKFRRRIWARSLLVIAIVACFVCYSEAWLAAPTNYLARATIAQRLPEKAIAWIRWSELVAGPTGDSEFLLARANRKLGRWDAFRDHLLRARELGVPETTLQREDWLARAQSGQMFEVERRRNQMLLDPQGDSEEICEAYAQGYLLNRQFQEAIRLLESWSADYPDNPQPHYLMGMTYAEWSNLPLAIQSLQRAVELDPEYFEARLALANAWLDSKDVREALAEFQKCRELGIDAEVDVGLARSHLALGAFEEAQRELDAGVARYPQNFKLQLEMARFLMHDEPGSALTHAETATSIAPRSSEARYVLGQILLRLGRRGEGQTHLEFAQLVNAERARMQKLMDSALTDPDNVELRFQIGVIQLKYGTEMEGIQWLQSVLNYDQGHKAANAALATYYESRASESATFAELASRHRNAATRESD
jgi:tetratricopeptide (TPR) repeat protein